MRNQNYFVEAFGCKTFNIPNYLTVLKCVSEDKKYMTEIADALEISGSGAYKIVSALEKRGYVNRLFWGTKRYVKLTDEGRELLKEAVE